MPLFAVQYEYDAAQTDALNVHRPAHREFLQGVQDAGPIVVRGPYTDGGAPGALIIVRADSAEQVTSLMDPDPFNTHGLIAVRTIREWGVLPGGLLG